MASKRFKCFNQRGFTLIEILFSLSICLLIILNTFPIVKTITYKDKTVANNSFYAIGVKQLTTVLYTAKKITVGNSLSFIDKDDKLYTISLHNNRIVKEPGFDIIIRDVYGLSFNTNNEKVYMNLSDGKNDFKYLIATNYINDGIDSGEENETH